MAGSASTVTSLSPTATRNGILQTNNCGEEYLSGEFIIS